MIFIDSNVPMYLIGSDHPNKRRARELLEQLIDARELLATSAEVFQEILHRYVAIERREAIETDVQRGIATTEAEDYCHTW